jgi:hypothetical protein
MKGGNKNYFSALFFKICIKSCPIFSLLFEGANDEAGTLGRRLLGEMDTIWLFF